MSVSKALLQRADHQCELCSKPEATTAYLVSPKTEEILANQVLLCQHCHAQITGAIELDIPHWRCLNESMWNPEPAVQVLAYRLLQKLQTEGWAQDLLGMIYLDDDTLEWAKIESEEVAIVHKDSNGNILHAGDTVTLIQDLNVKGASLTAKRGTAVRRIRLDPDNAEYIEGKVDGQQIVILTKYVKRSN